MEENKQKKAKRFLEQPQYPGGKKALRDFITAHLQYPEDAMNQRLEGVVTVAYQVDDSGVVENPVVIKGLSPSCNEEAIRLVKMLKYGQAHNRGVRLKSNCKIHIHFKLAPVEQKGATISYTVSSSSKPKTEQPKQKENYGYTITFGD